MRDAAPVALGLAADYRCVMKPAVDVAAVGAPCFFIPPQIGKLRAISDANILRTLHEWNAAQWKTDVLIYFQADIREDNGHDHGCQKRKTKKIL